MSELIRYVDERLANSITSPNLVINPVDKFAPLNFTEWLQYNNFLYTNTEDFLVRYQSYLNNWFTVTNTKTEDVQKIVRDYYTNLINEITLNYTTIDERRYLKNLDFSNSRDMALAIPFFAKKIKDVCIYFSTLRDAVETASTQYNLKGSNFGIETTLYNLFIRSLTIQGLGPNINTLSVPISSIKNDVVIEIEDIYDLYTDYYDINPVAPASAFNSFNDLRAEFFTLNQYEIDPDLFLDINTSILRAIFSYPFYLIELGENFYIDPVASADNLNYLKDSDYTELVSVSSIQALNLALKSQEMQKYAGADFYYVQTNTTGTAWVSGLLFTAQNEYANVLNKRFPTVAAVPSLEYLKTGKDIGLFFKPDKIGLLHFTNFKFSPSIATEKLEPNTIYYFPDPQKYGNVSSNTRLSFKTPFTFTEENYFNKIDTSNGYQFGDAYSDPYLHTFRAYQTREQSLDKSAFGLSRYEDSQDFFTGEKKDIWSNRDVYPLVPSNVFPIDNRQSKLLSLNKTLVQYKTDIYGNEFGLYKEIEPNRVDSNTTNVAGRTIIDNSSPFKPKISLAVDGHTFYDFVSGYNFDYTVYNRALNYSGVILKANSTPALGDALSFRLEEVPYQLYSYFYTPELFSTDYSKIIYDCSEVDTKSFVLPNGAPLPDFPSDSPQYTADNANLYYSILLDCGFSRFSPDSRATFGYPADFTYQPTSSALLVYDCHTFTDNGQEACGFTVKEQSLPLYTENNNFVDIRLQNRSTLVDATMSGIESRKTIYATRNTTYGDLYYRNSNSSMISPASAALSSIYIKYTPEIQTEINNQIINFDLYYDTIQIETQNYILFEQIQFDYATNTIDGGGPGINNIYKGDNPLFEKISTVWFNEADRELLVCKTTLFNEYSASNYKIIYPKIYTLRLDRQQLVQVFPLEKDSDLTFNILKDFSLSGKNIEINIVEIEKPVITFNDEDNIYTITYLGRDLAGLFYVFNTKFKYINGVLSDITVIMFKPGSDIYTQNFSNPEVGSTFETYSVLGSAVGNIDTATNTFTFCNTNIPEGNAPAPITRIPPNSFSTVKAFSGFNTGSTTNYRYITYYDWDSCIDTTNTVYESRPPYWDIHGVPNVVDGHVVFGAYSAASAVCIESTGNYAVTYPVGTLVNLTNVQHGYPVVDSDTYSYSTPDAGCNNPAGKKKFSLLTDTYPISAPGDTASSIYGLPVTRWFHVTSPQWGSLFGQLYGFLNSYAVWPNSGTFVEINTYFSQENYINIPTSGYYTISAQADNITSLYVDDNFQFTYNIKTDIGPVGRRLYFTAGYHKLTFDVINTGENISFADNPAGVAVVVRPANWDPILRPDDTWSTLETTVLHTIAGDYSFHFFKRSTTIQNTYMPASGFVTVYDDLSGQYYQGYTIDSHNVTYLGGEFKLYSIALNYSSIVSIQTDEPYQANVDWKCFMMKDGYVYDLGSTQLYQKGGKTIYKWNTPTSGSLLFGTPAASFSYKINGNAAGPCCF